MFDFSNETTMEVERSSNRLSNPPTWLNPTAPPEGWVGRIVVIDPASTQYGQVVLAHFDGEGYISADYAIPAPFAWPLGVPVQDSDRVVTWSRWNGERAASSAITSNVWAVPTVEQAPADITDGHERVLFAEVMRALALQAIRGSRRDEGLPDLIEWAADNGFGINLDLVPVEGLACVYVYDPDHLHRTTHTSVRYEATAARVGGYRLSGDEVRAASAGSYNGRQCMNHPVVTTVSPVQVQDLDLPNRSAEFQKWINALSTKVWQIADEEGWCGDFEQALRTANLDVLVQETEYDIDAVVRGEMDGSTLFSTSNIGLGDVRYEVRVSITDRTTPCGDMHEWARERVEMALFDADISYDDITDVEYKEA